MRRMGLTLCVAALVALAAIAAAAQTTCPVAQLSSPTPGSTLPAGAVTFEWCNANADYFLTVESVPGAHDIFNAFAGGVGPGAGVVSVTLGPACAPAPPTGCIPTNGETIYLTLWTLKKGTVVPPSPFFYTFIAANTAPTPTPTATASQTPTLSLTPTATAAPIPCVGDCNSSGQITVAEILTMVSIALGDANVSACTPGDANGNGRITVDEILTAVNNALNACPAG